MLALLAQTRHTQPGYINGLGPLGENVLQIWSQTFENVLSSIIGIITIIAGLWFIFILITGGISYMNAGGDKAAMEEARKRITTGFIGITIVVAGVFIAELVGYIVGINILNFRSTFSSIFP